MNLYGFTPQEYNVIYELMKVCKDMYITICLDEIDESKESGDIFFSNRLTKSKIIKQAKNGNIKIEKDIHLMRKS